jgi:hypothetical protein
MTEEFERDKDNYFLSRMNVEVISKRFRRIKKIQICVFYLHWSIKTKDTIFQNDITPLIRNTSEYDLNKASEYVKNTYIVLL